MSSPRYSIASFLQPVPTPAWALPPRQAPVPPASATVQHVTKAPTQFAPPKDTSTPFRATAITWPSPATADIALAVQSEAQPVAGTAVSARAVTRSDGTYGGPRQLQVRMHGHDAASAAGFEGVLLSVTPQQSGHGDVQVGLDYAAFAQAYGGNYGSRLRLVQLPACALTTPKEAACRIATPLASANDAVAKRVTATVPVQATLTQSTSPSLLSASAERTAAPMVLAATASSDPGQQGGAAGNYAATELTPSGTWSAGATPAGSPKYPIAMPPAASALVPDVA